jgi:predicted ATP-binding protein involved in virulence
MLRLDRLELYNFRCFTDCSLDLHPNLTMLVAENAQGKTAILSAIGIALDVFVATMAQDKNSPGFDRSDIHRVVNKGMVPASEVAFVANGFVENENVSWSRTLSSQSIRARSSTKDTKMMRQAAARLRGSLSDSNPITLPSVAFYGTGRLWDEQRLTKRRKWLPNISPQRLSTYLDCLSPSSSFNSFATWYEETANALRSSTSKVYATDEKPESLLAAVRKAVEVVLEPTGWSHIDWEFPFVNDAYSYQGRGYLVVEHNERGRLPLSWLSDGVRNMVALVGDLAHRCVRLNPHLREEAANRTPGILLIDEVDMHLHPRWQQLVVELLQRVFPQMQMIFTTHSPQVLSTVRKESIRVIKLSGGKGTFALPEYQTRGVESADVLATIMGVDPVPQVEEAKWLNNYRALIETERENSPEALSLRQQLISHFSDTHPVILDCDRLIRFQSFKRRNPQTRQD